MTIRVGAERVDVPSGSRLVRVCAEHDLPIVFGCRAARCGACLVQVLAGAGNVSPPAEREARVLEVLAAEPDWRLACQCVVEGDVCVRYV